MNTSLELSPCSHPTHDDDKLHEECGVVGIWAAQDASSLTALGLHALQHRGQEATGIVTYNEDGFHIHRGLGLVGEVFADPQVIAKLPGNSAIGHNRYATTGSTDIRNVQPLYGDFEFGGFAVAHNGNLTNAQLLKQSLVRRGCLFQSSTDSEVFIHLIAISLYTTVLDRFVDALKQVQGAYSVVALSKDMLIAARDPLGVRPLILGKLTNKNKDSWVVASETCALASMDAEFVRDIEPGEVIIINDEGVRSIKPFKHTSSRFCIFEYVYFARPDSIIDNKSVYKTRQKIGAELSKETPVEADVVVPVPDSGVPAAIGYAAASGIPFELGIIRSHYIGRTFIEPTDQIRHLGVKLKHSTNRAVIEGKRVVLIDDSIVRGTTSKKIVEMVRAAGATEVHLRIASPPTRFSCFYGIDTPTQNKLLAHTHSVEEMCKLIGADSLAFISCNGLYQALEEKERNDRHPQYCDACFTGDYPIPLTDHDMHLMEKK